MRPIRMEMPLCGRHLLAAALLVAAGLTPQFALGRKKDKPAEATTMRMDERKHAVHALNRMTFGPRPGDMERVTQLGVDKWIADGKATLPRDPTKRAVYEAQLQRYEDKQERKDKDKDKDKDKEEAAKGSPANDAWNAFSPCRDGACPVSGDSAQPADPEQMRRREERRLANLKTKELLDLPADERMKEILKMSPEDRRAIAATSKGAKAEALMEGMNPQQKETLMALNNPEQVVVDELMQAKMLRAIYSERQLDEVMTDFWLNHFNVFINKGADRYLLTGYERDVIRPHALGKFEDLLTATAQSPAMLFYLDNWLSVGPNSDFANGIPKRNNNYNWRRPPRQRRPAPMKQAKGKRSGLNENYGRELLELHTLGVNGGYTQKDVTEVARVLTGWTLKQPKQGGGFTFEERMHEPGDKNVLGHRIKSSGEKEGREALHILARHPSTAKFISTKLAMRFVSDNPPPALVDRMAQTFLKKDGDIREVLKTMFHSPEFWAPESYRAKVKTPLEFVVSAVRASGAEVSDALPLARQLQTMGMQLYGMQPPTGYSMKADAWVNSSALLGRMNFALALTAGKLKGVQWDSDHIPGAVGSPGDAQATLAALESSLLAGEVSRQTHDTIAAQMQMNDAGPGETKTGPPSLSASAGLLLGSPEFQRR